jgi:hypothetical protein
MITKSAQMDVVKIEGRSTEYAIARSELEPEVRHAALSINASADLFAGEGTSVPEMAHAMRDISAEVGGQDMSGVSRILTSQALSLDALFTQMARRAHLNLGEFPDAAERYMRLAFKAQAQSRATLEALVQLHQPREQTVRHVHVYEGGQAVVAEQLHMHGPGVRNARTDEQPRGPDERGPALLSHQPGGSGVSLTGSEGKAGVPDARRSRRKRSAERE